MRVRKLRLQNLRQHSDSTMDIQDATFVCIKGANFAGKSSIAQGISLLLTPSTDGLDATGRGFAVKIKRGENKATITGTIQGKSHTIERTVTLNTNTSGRTDRSECIDDPEFHPAPFEKFLEANRTALSVCLNTDAFLRMEEKSQKSLLARLALPSSYEFPSEKMEAVEKALGQGQIDFTSEPFAVIEKAYKLLYAERQVVNRQVKEFAVPDAFPSSSVDSDSLAKELTAAREERKNLLAQKDEAVNAANQTEVKRATLTQKINDLLEKLEHGKKRIKALDELKLSDEKKGELTKLAAQKDDLDLLTRYKIERTAKIADRERELAKCKSLPANQANCSACGQAISREYAASVVKEAEEALKMSRESLAETVAALEKLGDVHGAIASLAKHEADTKEREKIAGELTEIVTNGKAARAELLALGEAVNAAEPFTKPLADADARISTLTEQLRPAIAAEERAKEIATKTEQLKRLEAKAASIDALVKYFDKDGIKAELLSQYIGGFENKVNEVLRAFKYKCSLSIEPFKFEVTTARGDVSPVSEISGAEKLIFAAAFQCAVATASGVGLAVIDEVDRLHPEIRPILNKALYMLVHEGLLEQVVMIVADTSKDVPNLPGAAFFFVQDGNVANLRKA